MVRTVSHPFLPYQRQKAMNKRPRIISTFSLDINIFQHWDTTTKYLVSLPQVQTVVIEEYFPPLLSSNYYYLML